MRTSSDRMDAIYRAAFWIGLVVAIISFLLLFMLIPPELDILVLIYLLLGALGTIGALSSVFSLLLGATRRTLLDVRDSIVSEISKLRINQQKFSEEAPKLLQELRDLIKQRG